MNKLLLSSLLLSVLLVLPVKADARDDSLYQELGGTAGIEQIVEDLLFNSIDDRRIRHHFEGVDMVRLHEKLSEQICELAGGPCVYTGDDMVKSHTGMGVTRGDFNALVEGLQLAMDDNEVSVTAQNRLLALLAPMHEEIVGL